MSLVLSLCSGAPSRAAENISSATADDHLAPPRIPFATQESPALPPENAALGCSKVLQKLVRQDTSGSFWLWLWGADKELDPRGCVNAFANAFANAKEFEQFLDQNPATSVGAGLGSHSQSACMGEPSKDGAKPATPVTGAPAPPAPDGRLSDKERRSLIATYYLSMRRLNDSAVQSLQLIGSAGSLLGVGARALKDGSPEKVECSPALSNCEPARKNILESCGKAQPDALDSLTQACADAAPLWQKVLQPRLEKRPSGPMTPAGIPRMVDVLVTRDRGNLSVRANESLRMVESICPYYRDEDFSRSILDAQAKGGNVAAATAKALKREIQATLDAARAQLDRSNRAANCLNSPVDSNNCFRDWVLPALKHAPPTNLDALMAPDADGALDRQSVAAHSTLQTYVGECQEPVRQMRDEAAAQAKDVSINIALTLATAGTGALLNGFRVGRTVVVAGALQRVNAARGLATAAAAGSSLRKVQMLRALAAGAAGANSVYATHGAFQACDAEVQKRMELLDWPTAPQNPGCQDTALTSSVLPSYRQCLLSALGAGLSVVPVALAAKSFFVPLPETRLPLRLAADGLPEVDTVKFARSLSYRPGVARTASQLSAADAQKWVAFIENSEGLSAARKLKMFEVLDDLRRQNFFGKINYAYNEDFLKALRRAVELFPEDQIDTALVSGIMGQLGQDVDVRRFSALIDEAQDISVSTAPNGAREATALQLVNARSRLQHAVNVLRSGAPHNERLAENISAPVAHLQDSIASYISKLWSSRGTSLLTAPLSEAEQGKLLWKNGLFSSWSTVDKVTGQIKRPWHTPFPLALETFINPAQPIVRSVTKRITGMPFEFTPDRWLLIKLGQPELRASLKTRLPLGGVLIPTAWYLTWKKGSAMARDAKVNAEIQREAKQYDWALEHDFRFADIFEKTLPRAESRAAPELSRAEARWLVRERQHALAAFGELLNDPRPVAAGVNEAREEILRDPLAKGLEKFKSSWDKRVPVFDGGLASDGAGGIPLYRASSDARYVKRVGAYQVKAVDMMLQQIYLAHRELDLVARVLPEGGRSRDISSRPICDVLNGVPGYRKAGLVDRSVIEQVFGAVCDTDGEASPAMTYAQYLHKTFVMAPADSPLHLNVADLHYLLQEDIALRNDVALGRIAELAERGKDFDAAAYTDKADRQIAQARRENLENYFASRKGKSIAVKAN